MEAVEKTFVANLDTLPAIVGFVSEHAAAMGVHPKRVMHLELAVEEAAVNICSYAYEIPPGEITSTGLISASAGEARRKNRVTSRLIIGRPPRSEASR